MKMKKEESLDEEYEKIIPKDYRKKFGQFLTPVPVARFMVRWGLDEGTKRILDPSVGTGIFFSEVLKSKKKFERFLGIDIDANILEVAERRKELFRMENVNVENLELIKEDFFNLNSKDKFDFIVCNPPYMKFHFYDNKNLVLKMEKKNNLKLSKLTNIYALFFFNSLSYLKEGGVMAFITPAEFLYTNYGRELKEFLIRNFTIEAIILSDLDKTIFNGALTSATITLLRKRKCPKSHAVKFLKVNNWGSYDNLLNALHDYSIDSSDFSFRKINQKELKPNEKWLSYFEGNSILNKNNLIPLKKIARVKRGIATGFNDFFTLNSQEIEEKEIDSRFLRPVLSKATHCKGYNLSETNLNDLINSNENVFLLYCNEKPNDALKNYISYGRSIGAHQRYLTSKRNPWYGMEKRDPAKILATVFSRDKMRFIYNEAEVLNLASFHGIYPNFDEVNKVKALLAYLNSREAKTIISLQKRTYGGGLNKFEPKDLENIYVINLEALKLEIIDKLASLFDDLCLTKNKLDGDKILSEIDLIIRQVIGDV